MTWNSLLENSADVCRSLRSLGDAASLADCNAFQWIHFLPPFLCREMICNPAHVLQITTLEKALGGNDDLEIEVITTSQGSVHFVKAGFSEALYTKLPLDNHQLLKHVISLRDAIFEALALLGILSPNFLRKFHAFTGLIVPISAIGKSTPITSVSLPALPFCTFLTPMAQRHIAPNIVWNAISAYALAENLLHEALHHQLTINLLTNDLFVKNFNPRLAPKVTIPWRKVDWELDRILHAAFVYAGLVPLRKAFIEHAKTAEDRILMARALQAAGDNLNFLIHALQQHREYFSPLGWKLVEDLWPK